ncbi:hypothetical protein BJ741DRAFT_650202 [Chytriomyces cf. hyalinus JEL632]|nr:hypothetical protein BJ741DRAFT_650202 [Chytriomyces cf. hyalinus JEL632]
MPAVKQGKQPKASAVKAAAKAPKITVEKDGSLLRLVKVKASSLKEIPPPVIIAAAKLEPEETNVIQTHVDFSASDSDGPQRVRSKSEGSLLEIPDAPNQRRRIQSTVPRLSTSGSEKFSPNPQRPTTSHFSHIENASHAKVKEEENIKEKEEPHEKPFFKTSKQITKIKDDVTEREKMDRINGARHGESTTVVKPHERQEHVIATTANAAAPIQQPNQLEKPAPLAPATTTATTSATATVTATTKDIPAQKRRTTALNPSLSKSSKQLEHTKLFPIVLEREREMELEPENETPENRLDRLRRNFEKAQRLYEAEMRSLAIPYSTTIKQENVSRQAQLNGNSNSDPPVMKDTLKESLIVKYPQTNAAHNQKTAQYPPKNPDPPFTPAQQQQPLQQLPLQPQQQQQTEPQAPPSSYLQQFLSKQQQSFSTDPEAVVKLNRLAKAKEHKGGLNTPEIPRFIMEECVEPEGIGRHNAHQQGYAARKPNIVAAKSGFRSISEPSLQHHHKQEHADKHNHSKNPKPLLKESSSPRISATANPVRSPSSADHRSPNFKTTKPSAGRRIAFASSKTNVSQSVPQLSRKGGTDTLASTGGAPIRLPKISSKSTLSAAQKSQSIVASKSNGDNQLVQAQYQWLMQQAAAAGANTSMKGNQMFGNLTSGKQKPSAGKIPGGQGAASGGYTMPTNLVPAKFRLTQVPIMTMKPVIVIETTGQPAGTYLDGLTTFISMDAAAGGTHRKMIPGPPSQKRNRVRK